MKGTVGIKEANGNFYPIVEVFSSAKKRLLLTTAHDNQKSVQIDLYKSALKSMKDALYIGSIVVENIASRPKGSSSIEMILNSTREGVISVDVKEVENPSNAYHLTISLNSLEEDKRRYPDFEAGDGKARVKRQLGNFPLLPVLIGVVVLALILLLLWFFLFKGGLPTVQRSVQGLIGNVTSWVKTIPKPKAEKPIPAAPAAEEPLIIERPPDPPPPPPEPPKAAEPAKPAATAKPAPASSGRTPNRINAPRTIPPEGVVYKVRWGDTLWDISAAFYRNPRLYPLIARSNGITNPNRIVSGTELTILPRN
jgi:LysM repeat protein